MIASSATHRGGAVALAVAALGGLLGSPLYAQSPSIPSHASARDAVVLPPTFTADPAGFGPPTIRLAQNTDAVSRTTEPADEFAPPRRGPGGPHGRPGLLQGIDLNAEWSPRLADEDGLGRSTLGATLKLGVPPKLVGMPMMVSTGASLHLLDGPAGIDLPPRLYDLQLGLRSFRRINDRWNLMGGANIGVYGDDDSLGESEALRPSGMLLAMYDASPTIQWTFGVVATSREDLPVIPVAGVTIDRGDVRYELTMPRPRIVWRRPAAAGETRSLFVAGELGGGAWAVRRDSGVTDTLNLSRYGLVLGYEAATEGGWKRRYELGYLTGQEVEYIDADEEFDLADSLILRTSWSY